jgi:hypothetical protein
MSKSILSYAPIVGFLISPVYGYDHWDFDGDIGQGWHFEGTPQWHLDCNERHNGSCSMRSGEILPFSGPTSIWREVQGPAIISFWWKADSIQVCTDPSVMCKGLFLLVDGKTQWSCNSSDWKEARFPLTDGLHRVEWIFKPRSDRKGTGWLDDVSIAPFPVTTESTYQNHNISFQVPANWRITKDVQLGNDTFVMLNNSSSFIRIDIVSFPLLPTLRSFMNEHTSTFNYFLMDHFTWMQKDRTNWENLTASWKVHPDGLNYMSFQSIGNSTIMFAWTKPEYGDRYIAIKGNFFGPQDVMSLYGYYGVLWI